METETIDPGKQVMTWEEELAAEAKALAKFERPAVQRFSFKGGLISYGGVELAKPEIEVVIVAAQHENVYYDKPWEEDVVHPPACYAYSWDGENMRPHPDIENPQHPTCDGCPQSKFDSHPNGRGGKACGQRRKLAVLPTYEKPEDYSRAEVGVMSIPVMSVKNWSNYVNFLSTSSQRTPYSVVTKMELVRDKKAQFKATFTPVRSLTKDFVDQIRPKIALGQSVLETPYDLTPPEEKTEPEKPAKKAKF